MGYFLIIIGVIAIVSGIIMLTSSDEQTSSPSRQDTNFASTAINTKPIETHNNRNTDTVVVERVVEKKVETPVPVKETSTAVENEKKEIKTETSTDTNKAKGDAFEDFVVNLLADWRLKLLDRTQDHKSSAGVVAESSKNPDLHIEQKRGKSEIDYYIECKYRSRWDKGAVNFEEWQINRYRKFQRDSHRKVVVALGVGGTPSAPATLRLVPLDSITNNSIREIDTKFAVQPTSAALIDYMNNYFSSVFKASKERKAK